MKRFYSPDSYCNSGQCINDLLTQRIKSSYNMQSAISLNTYQSNQTKKIGRYYYNEKDQIGQGYTSKVYKAYTRESIITNNPTSQTYAIKVISLSKSTPSSVQLLQNEVQILKMLDHPNIIKCYDIYKSKTHCYIITEYCPGGCLMNYLNKQQPYRHANSIQNINSNKKVFIKDQDKVINIVQQIVQGVKYLQLKGIIHRDIKPANILKGKTMWKIADFGFAIKSINQVKSKFNVGTPLYMPIQSLTQNLYSPQSDIFSIGIILFQLLTGTTPWESKSQKQLIRKMELIPLEKTSNKNKISSQIFSLIVRLCSLRKRNRMTKQEFTTLSISQAIKSIKFQQNVQNPQILIGNFKEDFVSIKSDILFERKLRQNRSMDHLDFCKQKQNVEQKNKLKYYSTGSMIFERNQKPQQTQQIYKNKSLLMHNEKQKQKQQNDVKNLKSYGSKKQIYWSIKDKYFDIPSSSIKSTNLKKNYPIQTPKYFTKQSNRLELKQSQKKQDYTRSTQAKQQQVYLIKQIPQKQVRIEQNSKYIDEISHILLNQIHFCRFLFYLYKNSLYILLCKKSQQRLSVLIFKLIFETLDELIQIQVLNSDIRQKCVLLMDEPKLNMYLSTQKWGIMMKTIKQYRQKYNKQFSSFKIKLGRKILQEIQIQQKVQQQLFNKSLRSKQNKLNGTKTKNVMLEYIKKNLRQLLKQYDHNLILTIDSISISQLSSPRYLKDSNNNNGSNKQNGFISANMQGLRNLYQFYRLVNILIECNKDICIFESKSKIKVNTDYSKAVTNNNNYQSSQIQKIRSLIQLL